MANSGLNSFSENMRQVMINQTNQLSLLTSMQKSMSENSMYSVYEWNDADLTLHEFQLPTFSSIHNRITNIEKSIESLLTGRGTISTDDNNRFHVTIKTVPSAPDNISYLADPDMFFTDPNWIFEDFMFPASKVRITLTGQIDDRCKQVHYKRVIVDSNKSNALIIWNNRLKDHRYTYPELINLLVDNGINYYEDTQTVSLPHLRNQYWGVFQINGDPVYENKLAWYTLDTIEYSTIDVNGTNQGANNVLKVGDNLTYNGALFEILEIRTDTLQVRMKCINGVAIPGNGAMMHYYTDVTVNKWVDIRFGAHEYNFVYLKAVSPDNNILSNAWSQCIKFASDELSYINDENVNFLSYYESSVYDWGAQLLAEVKEKRIPAFMGVQPNKPVLNESDFKVVQINTHFNKIVPEKELELQIGEIERAKSHIDSLNSTLKQLRTELVKTTSATEYKSIQENIQNNLTNLETAQRSYTTIANAVKSNNKINRELIKISAKYRIRGFFPYPAPVYYDSEKKREQPVIGFEIAYRYLSENKQGAALERYEYTDSDSSKLDAIFSDWNITQSKIKERVYNAATDTYEWVEESTSDSTTVNINQIDIPIQQGECVEVKVRSITAAGYPENPLKSDWSNSVIIEFPDELKGKNTLQDAIDVIESNINRAEFRDVLSQEGILSHLQDSVIATDGTGINFNHMSKYIAYEDVNAAGVLTMSLQSKIQSLDTRIAALEKSQNTLGEVVTRVVQSGSSASKMDKTAADLPALDLTDTTAGTTPSVAAGAVAGTVSATVTGTAAPTTARKKTTATGTNLRGTVAGANSASLASQAALQSYVTMSTNAGSPVAYSTASNSQTVTKIVTSAENNPTGIAKTVLVAKGALLLDRILNTVINTESDITRTVSGTGQIHNAIYNDEFRPVAQRDSIAMNKEIDRLKRNITEVRQDLTEVKNDIAAIRSILENLAKK